MSDPSTSPPGRRSSGACAKPVCESASLTLLTTISDPLLGCEQEHQHLLMRASHSSGCSGQSLVSSKLVLHGRSDEDHSPLWLRPLQTSSGTTHLRSLKF